MRRDLLTVFERQFDLEHQAHEDNTQWPITDNQGRLFIHRALQNPNTSAGAIKLMLAANPPSPCFSEG